MHAVESISAPLSAERAHLLEYDSRLGLLKLARRFRWDAFLVLDASFGSRRRWTRFNKREGDFRTATTPGGQLWKGLKEKDQTRPSRGWSCTCKFYMMNTCFILFVHTCEDGTLVTLKIKTDQISSSVDSYSTEQFWSQWDVQGSDWKSHWQLFFGTFVLTASSVQSHPHVFLFLFLCLKQRFHWCAVWQIFKVFKTPKTALGFR